MKKIGIVTLVHVRNIGAGLQAYAMQEILKKKDCETVYMKGYGRKAAKELFSWDLNLRFPSAFRPHNFKFYFDKIIKFEKFFHKFNEKRISKKIVDSCDSVILGSDSIWMPKIISNRMDPCFFGAIPHKKISAYAPSIGGERDINAYSREQLEPLSNLKLITVRDTNTKDFVKNVTGRDVEIVLDPTLLIDWEEVLRREKLAQNPLIEKYLLIYGWFPEKCILKMRNYAQKKKLKIVNVGLLTDGGDICLAVSPLEFVQYVLFAEGIVTCMFHGVMLSLAMEKQFCYIPQDSNRNKKIATTMERFGIKQEEYYWDYEKEDLKFDSINYDHIRSNKKRCMKESLEWIQKMI